MVQIFIRKGSEVVDIIFRQSGIQGGRGEELKRGEDVN
jgi:hypothetical protein